MLRRTTAVGAIATSTSTTSLYPTPRPRLQPVYTRVHAHVHNHSQIQTNDLLRPSRNFPHVEVILHIRRYPGNYEHSLPKMCTTFTLTYITCGHSATSHRPSNNAERCAADPQFHTYLEREGDASVGTAIRTRLQSSTRQTRGKMRCRTERTRRTRISKTTRRTRRRRRRQMTRNRDCRHIQRLIPFSDP